MLLGLMATIIVAITVDRVAQEADLPSRVVADAHALWVDLTAAEGAIAVSLGALSISLFAFALWPWWRPHWHHFANTHWVEAPKSLRQPWVVDGDTINDLADNKIYRFANIDALMQRGLAVPWEGRRKKWCGPNGGLARIAHAGAEPFECRTCRHWR